MEGNIYGIWAWVSCGSMKVLRVKSTQGLIRPAAHSIAVEISRHGLLVSLPNGEMDYYPARVIEKIEIRNVFRND